MGGKFLNTDIRNTIESLSQGIKKRIRENPFYYFNDKNPTIVTYYNPDQKASTLDTTTKTIYAIADPESGLRFNKINNTVLYGLEKILLGLDFGEFGPEAQDVTGEALLLPNTFIPYPEGLFTINHLGKDIIFRVNTVDMDTYDDGGNFYKIGYKLETFASNIAADLVKLTIGEYEMISGNFGTQYRSVVLTQEYQFIDELQCISSTLRDYYNSLFFRHRLQTYTYIYNENYFYDPYMIEFIIRNHILDAGPDKYMYITQQVALPRTFCIDYDNTIFRNLETKNIKADFKRAYGVLVDDPFSLLTQRLESYFMIDYGINLGVLADPLDIYDTDFIQAIREKKTFDIGSPHEYYNIISTYFSGKPLTQPMIDSLEKLNYFPSVELFYNIPIIIFILEKYIIDLLKNDISKLS